MKLQVPKSIVLLRGRALLCSSKKQTGWTSKMLSCSVVLVSKNHDLLAWLGQQLEVIT